MAIKMSKNRIITVVAMVAVAAIVAIAVSHNSASPSESMVLSKNATDFTLPTMTGANITLSELEGTPVVLNFWSISCPWCRYQLPFLEAVAQQSKEEIKVIAINTIDSAANVQKFFGDYEPTMIVALDGNRGTFADYCRTYDNPQILIPFTLFVDSEGVVQYTRIGAFASQAQLWDTLSDVLGITAPQTS